MQEPLSVETGQARPDSARRDQAIARMFRADESIWLLSDAYDALHAVWHVHLLCQGQQGRWMRRRYHYDVATGVIFFMGERPVADEELRPLRRSARRLRGTSAEGAERTVR